MLRSVARYGSSSSAAAIVRPALRVVCPVRVEISAEPDQSLRGDRRCGRIHRLEVVERIGGAILPVAQLRQARRTVVPIDDAVGGGAVVDVMIAGVDGRLLVDVATTSFRQPDRLLERSRRRSSRRIPAPRRIRASPTPGRGSTC